MRTTEASALFLALALSSSQVSAFTSGDTTVRRNGSRKSLASSRALLETNTYLNDILNDFPSVNSQGSVLSSNFIRPVVYSDFLQTQGDRDEFLFETPASYIYNLKRQPIRIDSQEKKLTKAYFEGLKGRTANSFYKALGPSSYLGLLETIPKTESEKSKPSTKFADSVSQAVSFNAFTDESYNPQTWNIGNQNYNTNSDRNLSIKTDRLNSYLKDRNKSNDEEKRLAQLGIGEPTASVSQAGKSVNALRSGYGTQYSSAYNTGSNIVLSSNSIGKDKNKNVSSEEQQRLTQLGIGDLSTNVANAVKSLNPFKSGYATPLQPVFSSTRFDRELSSRSLGRVNSYMKNRNNEAAATAEEKRLTALGIDPTPVTEKPRASRSFASSLSRSFKDRFNNRSTTTSNNESYFNPNRSTNYVNQPYDNGSYYDSNRSTTYVNQPYDNGSYFDSDLSPVSVRSFNRNMQANDAATAEEKRLTALGIDPSPAREKPRASRSFSSSGYATPSQPVFSSTSSNYVPQRYDNRSYYDSNRSTTYVN
jgi:hypothetical protein